MELGFQTLAPLRSSTVVIGINLQYTKPHSRLELTLLAVSKNTNWGEGGLCSVFCPPYPTAVFVLAGVVLASSQGLAGTPDKRHPAAAKRKPKSMSSQKHSTGKMLHNQMGFPPLLSTLFYGCCRQARWGFDADTRSKGHSLFALVM